MDIYDDFHDALIDRLEIDFAARQVVMVLQVHIGEASPVRTPMTITFTTVRGVTTSADLMSLQDNAFAGHVSHAHLADGAGTSHIYLVEGYLAVTADAPPRLSATV